MNPREYLETQVAICRIAEIICQLPLTEFIEAIDKADTLGPVLDPTAWREGHKPLEKVKGLAQSLAAVKALRTKHKEGIPREVTTANDTAAEMMLRILKAT